MQNCLNSNLNVTKFTNWSKLMTNKDICNDLSQAFSKLNLSYQNWYYSLLRDFAINNCYGKSLQKITNKNNRSSVKYLIIQSIFRSFHIKRMW